MGQGASFHDNRIEDNGDAGLRIWKTPLVTFHDNIVRGNLFGVQCIVSVAELRCNTIDSSARSGVILYPQAYADMTGPTSRNQLADNVTDPEFELEHGQITLAGGIADIGCGLNTIMDGNNERWLIKSWYDNTRRTGWDATLNWWGTDASDRA